MEDQNGRIQEFLGRISGRFATLTQGPTPRVEVSNTADPLPPKLILKRTGAVSQPDAHGSHSSHSSHHSHCSRAI